MMNNRANKILIAALFGTAFLTTHVTAYAADVTQGLVGHWSFDDCSGTDDSGLANHGAIHGNPQCVDGINGKALHMNGSTDYVEVPDSPSLNPQQLTVIAWINPESYPNYANIVVNKEVQYEFAVAGNTAYDDTQANELAFALVPNFFWYGTRNYHPPIGKFIQVALTFNDKNQGSIYVNGVLKRTVNYDKGLTPSGRCLRIGARGCPAEASAFFNGLIDDVRIYNRALSKTEIKTLYFNTVPAVVAGKIAWPQQPYKLICKNYSNNTQVIFRAKQSERYNCEKRGLVAQSGDDVSITAIGLSLSPPKVQGLINWAKPPYAVTCTNNTTGAPATVIARNGKTRFNCVTAGLQVNPGDKVTVTVRGKKY